MKQALFLLFAMVLGNTAFAAETKYSCVDAKGIEGILTVYNYNEVHWSEEWYSAESRGQNIGRDHAPFSPRKGYTLYKLYDFYFGDDFHYVIALHFVKGNKVDKVSIYLDNDDHAEEENYYDCKELKK